MPTTTAQRLRVFPLELVSSGRFEATLTISIILLATSSWPASLLAVATMPFALARDLRDADRWPELAMGWSAPSRPLLLRGSLALRPFEFAWLGAALLGTAILSFADAPLTLQGFQLLAQFSAVPIVALIFCLVPARVDVVGALWQGVTAGALGAGAIAAVEMLAGTPRAEGLGANAIIFGDIALLLGVLSLTLLPAIGDGDLWCRRAAAAAAASGVFASFLSGSRGGWIAVPALALVVAYQYRRRLDPSRWRRSLVGGVAAVVGVAWLARGVLSARIAAGYAEISQYRGAAPRDPAAGTSIGARIESWRAAWAAFWERPVTGIGWGNLSSFFDVQAYSGFRNPRIATFEHAHHQLLSSLASSGLIGMVAFVAVGAVPACWFVRAWRSDDARQQALGASGLVVVIGFAISGLTEAVLENFVAVVAYAVMIAALAGQLEPARAVSPLSPASKAPVIGLSGRGTLTFEGPAGGLQQRDEIGRGASRSVGAHGQIVDPSIELGNDRRGKSI